MVIYVTATCVQNRYACNVDDKTKTTLTKSKSCTLYTSAVVYVFTLQAINNVLCKLSVTDTSQIAPSPSAEGATWQRWLLQRLTHVSLIASDVDSFVSSSTGAVDNVIAEKVLPSAVPFLNHHSVRLSLAGECSGRNRIDNTAMVEQYSLMYHMQLARQDI